MKKSFIFLFFMSFSIFCFSLANAGGCGYNGDISSSLSSCLGGTDLVNPGGSLDIGNGNFQNKLYYITYSIATVLSLGAIFGILYGSFLLVTAGGEDEKIKKGKDVIKWSILGFLGVVLASSIITLIVYLFYSIG